jgi:hypothetical protein
MLRYTPFVLYAYSKTFLLPFNTDRSRKCFVLGQPICSFYDRILLWTGYFAPSLTAPITEPPIVRSRESFVDLTF